MFTVSVPTPDTVALLGDLPDDVEVLVWDGTGERPAGAEHIRMFVGRYDAPPPPRETFEHLAELEVLQLVSAGVEPWLKVLPDGVVLCNGRGIHGATTAELAVAGMLAVLRGVPGYAAAQREHQWDRSHAAQTDSLAGRAVLVVGAGDIGRRIAAVARVLDASTTMVARTARDGVHGFDELLDLLPQHDVVALAAPHTPQTHGIVDARFLAAMPDGALLVNIARGQLVDTDALLDELRAERLRAFLDVTDPEPLPPEHPLWGAPNLLLTPHVGGGTRGWEQRAYRLVREQLLRLHAGEQLHNRVEHGY
ncbi:2-hydroxyacid dehydrogenase [uncultured Jatrophihabitans sp.]|uniref:2-hydroxyacid dehydrogenase n=1 Tax=uncultured Jatrophihabitans sp. TaxID=1610747 RepID=UPI0035CCA8CC